MSKFFMIPPSNVFSLIMKGKVQGQLESCFFNKFFIGSFKSCIETTSDHAPYQIFHHIHVFPVSVQLHISFANLQKKVSPNDCSHLNIACNPFVSFKTNSSKLQYPACQYRKVSR